MCAEPAPLQSGVGCGEGITRSTHGWVVLHLSTPGVAVPLRHREASPFLMPLHRSHCKIVFMNKPCPSARALLPADPCPPCVHVLSRGAPPLSGLGLLGEEEKAHPGPQLSQTFPEHPSGVAVSLWPLRGLSGSSVSFARLRLPQNPGSHCLGVSHPWGWVVGPPAGDPSPVPPVARWCRRLWALLCSQGQGQGQQQPVTVWPTEVGGRYGLSVEVLVIPTQCKLTEGATSVCTVWQARAGEGGVS